MNSTFELKDLWDASNIPVQFELSKLIVGKHHTLFKQMSNWMGIGMPASQNNLEK